MGAVNETAFKSYLEMVAAQFTPLLPATSKAADHDRASYGHGFTELFKPQLWASVFRYKTVAHDVPCTRQTARLLHILASPKCLLWLTVQIVFSNAGKPA